MKQKLLQAYWSCILKRLSFINTTYKITITILRQHLITGFTKKSQLFLILFPLCSYLFTLSKLMNTKGTRYKPMIISKYKVIKRRYKTIICKLNINQWGQFADLIDYNLLLFFCFCFFYNQIRILNINIYQRVGKKLIILF